ncbi:YeeE/YedE family protein [Actinomyces sp.]|uniref:YeeE/YedE family protein n=1 Tax=Actinomyces sp. TaxID=29317 RepID=UPI0026DCDCDE|nr:YeeE/YedE family protein [Actinomyces sp.]MDO4901627.1 YeeE/YedE family protein [Actinomyces sp.]
MILTGLLVGGVLGLILQRGRFCITGAFRDLWVSGSWRWMTAFLLAVAVQAVGVTLLTSTGAITPEVPTLSVVATAAGSLLFGVGIVLAGGCATGTYYRAGEGLVGSWFALIAYAVTAAASKTGVLEPLTTWVKGLWATELTTIPATFGLPDWVGVLLLAAGVALLVRRQRLLAASRPVTAQLDARRTGLNHLLFERSWSPLATGVLVGLVAIIAWPTSWASGRHDGLGITTPSSNLVGWLVTGDGSRLDWGVLLVLGILIGSHLSARASGEFRVRVPSATVIRRSIAGGLLMGVGAAWAGGCSIGNALVQTSLLSWQGWTALVFQVLGVGAAAYVTLIRPRNRRRAARAAAAATASEPRSVSEAASTPATTR